MICHLNICHETECPSWHHLAQNVTSPFAGTQLTVEIHPQDAMPQLLKKFSLAKRTYMCRAAQTEGRQGQVGELDSSLDIF